MKSTKFSGIIKGFQSQVQKRATKGERIMGSLFPNRGIGWPGGWGEDRIEQVLHLKNWTYVAIDAIACKIAQMIPNMAYVHNRRIPGKTEKYAESKIGTFGGTNVIDGMGHSFLTTGSYHRKALSVIKPHEQLEPLPHDHLCRRLIEEPNAVDTAYDLLYEMDMFLELCGVAYLWAVPSKLGNPCELWSIPSHWVWPRTGGGQYVQPDNAFADRLIQYYEVRPWGGLGSAGMLRFPPNEVIMIPFKSPINKLSGYSKLTAGDQWIDSEESISKSRWSQFNNMARPELWMELGEGYNDPNDARIARIEAKFMNKYQGEGNYGRPIITPPGAKLSVLSFNPTEMAYFQSEEQIRDMILSLFRVPKAVVGISNDMTFGSILATLAAFSEFCLNPRLAMIGQRLTKFLGSRFNTDDAHVRIWWDNTAPSDPQQVNSDLQADFSAGAITTNEWRAIRGRAPYKHGGDDPLVSGPGGLVPLPLNTGDDLTELGKLVPTLGQQEQEEQPGIGEEGAPPSEAGQEGEEQGGEPTLAELAEGGDAGLNEGAKIDDPNGQPTKGLNGETSKRLDKAGLRKQWQLMEKVLDRATGGKTPLPDALEAMAELKAWSWQVEKKQDGPVAAGLAVVAGDTGRVLLIQRPIEEDNDNGGKWEFPGGKRDEGEHPLETAAREWTEEVGHPLPDGELDQDRQWVSSNGKYAGHVYKVDSEDAIDLANRKPDADPASGGFNVVAWVHPRDMENHNLRPELLGDMDEVMGRISKYLRRGLVITKSGEGTCGRGERADLTGCTPASGGGGPRNVPSTVGNSQGPAYLKLPSVKEWRAELKRLFESDVWGEKISDEAFNNECTGGLCSYASMALMSILAKRGVKTRDANGGYEGGGDYEEGGHDWLVGPKGEIIDPTESQFNPDLPPGHISVYPPGSPGAEKYREQKGDTKSITKGGAPGKVSSSSSHSGKPCKPGISAARTGCIPKKKPKPGDKKKPQEAAPETQKPKVGELGKLLNSLLSGETPITSAHIGEIKGMLMDMTVPEIQQMIKGLGIQGKGTRADLANKIYEMALGKAPKTNEEPENVQLPDESSAEEDNVELPGDEPEGSDAGAGEGDGEEPEEAGGTVAPEAGGPNDEAAGGEGTDEGESPGGEPVEDVPVKVKGVLKSLKGYEQAFAKGGLKDQAAWMKEFQTHIKTLGVEAALAALGEEKEARSADEKIQYVGAYEDLIAGEGDDNAFVKKYLEQAGIVLAGSTIDPNLAVISSWSKKNIEAQAQGHEIPEAPQNYVPTDQTVANKLEESKLLPGLESSEDIHKVVGSNVTHFTPEVVAKLDEAYGKGKWIVKSYGDEAYAGFGIFFPQRAAQIKRDSKALMADAKSSLKQLGFLVARDKAGKVIGVRKGKQIVAVGTEEYGKLAKTVQKLGRQAIQASFSENGTTLPTSPEDAIRNDYGASFIRDKDGVPIGITNYDGKEIKFEDKAYKAIANQDGGAAGYAIKRAVEADEWRRKGMSTAPKFMVQPAFPAVGVSEADRAIGATWETATEGRVHVVVRNGKASAVPFATLMGRGDDLPAVFQSDDSRAMEKAVEDAINALPESERTGQMYAPDVMKTKDGWKVIELNPSAVGGGSNWLGQNPFVIDAVVSHMTNKEPQHARFVRDLLRGKLGKKAPFPMADIGGKKPESHLPDVGKKELEGQVEKGKDHAGQPCKPGWTAARTGCIAHTGSQGRTVTGQMAAEGQKGAIYTVKHGNLTSRYSIHSNKRIDGPSIPLKNYQQQDDHSCGFVAALTLSRHFDPTIPAPVVLKAVRPTKSAGVNEVQLAKALQEVGVATTYKTDLTISKLRKCVENGIPVLISVYPEAWSSDHWTIVQGFDNEKVYLTNHKSMSIAEFKKQWYVPGEGYLCKPNAKKPADHLPKK